MLTTCQACHSQNIESFYRTDNIPVHSCLMVDSASEAKAFPKGDLELTVCHECGFIQNARYDAALQNYSTDYEETQAFSPRFQQFLDEICDDQIKKYDLKGKTALEIGCGKGEFLVTLCERGELAGIGIDPSYRPERTQSEAMSRLNFIQDFYGPKYRHLQADYVACRHTLEHIGPVHQFMTLVREAIGPDRKCDVFFELPDVERVLTEGAFWDIYYEHCTYFTLGSLARLFRATNFDVHDLWKAYDGQYLMLEATPTESPTQPRLSEEDDLTKTLAQVRTFKTQVTARIDQLRNEVRNTTANGGKVAIWGSGSKGVSFLCTLGLDTGDVQAVVDINPHKRGKFLAGTGHEIVAPTRLQEIKPELVVVMNPIYMDEIGKDLKELGLDPRTIAV